MATEVKKAVDLGLLEEDDEFEEFPAESKYRHYNKSKCYNIANSSVALTNLLLCQIFAF